MRKCSSKFQTTFALLGVCFFWLGVAASLQAQGVPQDFVKCCVGVKCKGSNSYVVVPGYGETPDLACADAKNSAFKLCGGLENVDSIRQTKIETILCPYAEATSSNLFVKSATEPEVWRVTGKLCYCDGSDCFEFTTSGPTRCEAIKIAHDRLCEAKDPCKRACITIRVIETPTSTCQTMMKCR